MNLRCRGAASWHFRTSGRKWRPGRAEANLFANKCEGDDSKEVYGGKARVGALRLPLAAPSDCRNWDGGALRRKDVTGRGNRLTVRLDRGCSSTTSNCCWSALCCSPWPGWAYSPFLLLHAATVAARALPEAFCRASGYRAATRIRLFRLRNGGGWRRAGLRRLVEKASAAGTAGAEAGAGRGHGCDGGSRGATRPLSCATPPCAGPAGASSASGRFARDAVATGTLWPREHRRKRLLHRERRQRNDAARHPAGATDPG
jgi:hypothetical protein